MVHSSAIFSVLLAILLVFVPAPCLCPQHSSAAAGSCCVSMAPAVSPRGHCPLCSSQTDFADDPSPATRGTDDRRGEKSSGSHCGLHCSCRQGPSMVAQTPPALPAFAPITLPMAISFQMLAMWPDPEIRHERLAAHAPARPVVTLLRLQCALTI